MRKRPLHTFLFADLVGYTALTGCHGDEAAAEVAVRFGAQAARLAAEHDAQVLKAVGDAVLIRADRATDAVRLALRLDAELSGAPSLPPIHAGAHTGYAIERDGDWYGAAVNLAARVAGAGRGREGPVSPAAGAGAGGKGGGLQGCP